MNSRGIVVELRCPKGHVYKSLNHKMNNAPCPICNPKPAVFKEKPIIHKEPL